MGRGANSKHDNLKTDLLYICYILYSIPLYSIIIYYIYIYIYVYVYVCVYIYIYIYILCICLARGGVPVPRGVVSSSVVSVSPELSDISDPESKTWMENTCVEH